MRVHSTSLNLNDETRIYGGSQGKLLIVADGMGGEAEGERASTIAVDQLATYVLNSLSWCFRLEEESEQDFQDHLKEALQSCQKSIRTVVSQHPEMKGMGTTMTMVYIVWPRAFVVHVGDSRCYLLRDRQLEQVTEDHTMAALVAQASRSTANKRESLPWAMPCGMHWAGVRMICPLTCTNYRSSRATSCCSARTAFMTWCRMRSWRKS